MSSVNEIRRGKKWSLAVGVAVLPIALLAAGCCRPCEDEGGGTPSGTGASLVGGGWGNFQGMATTNYYGMFHGFRGTTSTEVASRIATAGTLTEFAAAITTAAPTGSWTFTLHRNGVAEAMSCAISGADTSCVVAASCVELAAGDGIAVEVVPSGATANAGGPRWTALFGAGQSCP